MTLCFFFFQLKKTLNFSDDDYDEEDDDVEDEGTQRAALGSMVFPAECYDDDNTWLPLTPRNIQNTHTPHRVSTTHTPYIYMNTQFQFLTGALQLLLKILASVYVYIYIYITYILLPVACLSIIREEAGWNRTVSHHTPSKAMPT